MHTPLSEQAALRAHTEFLAHRIASFPASAVSRAKQSIINAIEMQTEPALFEERFLFAQTTRTPEACLLCGGTRERAMRRGEGGARERASDRETEIKEGAREGNL